MKTNFISLADLHLKCCEARDNAFRNCQGHLDDDAHIAKCVRNAIEEQKQLLENFKKGENARDLFIPKAFGRGPGDLG